jgi:hypothetical protein
MPDDWGDNITNRAALLMPGGPIRLNPRDLHLIAIPSLRGDRTQLDAECPNLFK